MKKYTDYKGNNPIAGPVLKTLILNGEFLSAWYYVCVYILKMDIEDFQKAMMAHRVKYNNTLIMAGRGLGKSFLLTTGYVLTSILKDKNIAIAVITRTQRQSISFVSELKKYFEKNGVVQEIFGDLKGETWTDLQFTLVREVNRLECTVTACAIGSPSSLVSKHYDILIIDDIVNMRTSSTRYMRDKTEETLYQDIIPAMHPLSKYQYVHVVGTHFHADDIYVRLANKKTYKTLKIPSLVKDKNGKMKSIWKNIPKKTLQRILDFKDDNLLAFEQQYQQIVRKGDGGIFKAEWIQYFHKYKQKNGETFVYMEDKNGKKEEKKINLYAGVDLAISQSETADYFVFAVIGVDENKNIFILDFDRGRYTFQQQKKKVKEMAEKWEGLERIGIETVAYQQALFQEISRETSLPIVKIKTTRDKVSRLNVFGALFENEKVFFYSHIENSSDMINEFLEFPDAEHDDIPDATCMAWETSKSNKKRSKVKAGPDLSRLGWG